MWLFPEKRKVAKPMSRGRGEVGNNKEQGGDKGKCI